jgi:hypothetical protein
MARRWRLCLTSQSSRTLPRDQAAGRHDCGSSKLVPLSMHHPQLSRPLVGLRRQWHTRMGLERPHILASGPAEFWRAGVVTTTRSAESRNLMTFWSTLTSACRGGRVSVRLSSPLAAAVYPNAALRAAIRLKAARPRRHQRSRTADHIEAGTAHRSSVVVDRSLPRSHCSGSVEDVRLCRYSCQANSAILLGG